MKRIIALVLFVTMLLSLAACKDDGNEETVITAKDVAMKSENYSFNMAEATYIFNRYYLEFQEENSQYLSFYGIDRTKSLKQQEYSGDETWFDYFLDLTRTYLHELLLFCEGAKANGVALDDEDIKDIDDIIDMYIEEAEGNAYTVEEYISLVFGTDVTIDDMRTFIEKEKLAFKYYNQLVEGYIYTDEDEDKYLSENPDEFYYVHYESYTFNEKKDRDAKANAAELKSTADAASFYEYISSYEENVLKLDEDSRVGATKTSYATKEDNELGDWAFSAKVGDKFTVEDEAKGIYVTYMLTAEPALHEYTVRDIRYICLTKDTYQTNEAAKNKANDIIEMWQKEGSTPEAFGELAERYSEDDSTNENGGICTSVDRSNSILDEEGQTWLFETAVPGECKIFKGESMYYIVYYEAEGDVQWRAYASLRLAERAYAEDNDEMEASFKIDAIENVLYAIDE